MKPSYIFKQIKSQIVIIIVLALALIVTISYLNYSTQDKKLPITPTTSTPPPLKNPPLTLPPNLNTSKNLLSYQAVEVGKTTDKEVSKLKNIKKKEVLEDNQVKYTFESVFPSADSQIITKQGLVEFKAIVTVDPETKETPNFSYYTNLYGTPDKEFVGSEAFGKFVETYIYLKQGLAFKVNPFTLEVYGIQTFKPTTLEDYLKKWGQDIKEYPKEEEDI